MHVERFDNGQVTLVQALVRFPRLPDSERWWSAFARRTHLADGLPEMTTAFRLEVDEAGRALALFSLTVTAGDEAQLRRCIASFAWLEGIVSGTVSFVHSAADYTAAAAFPPRQCTLLPEPLQAGGRVWLAQAARLTGHVPLLMEQAATLGHRFVYQILFRPWQPDRDLIRRAGRNLIALRALPGVPAAVDAEQERVVRRLRTATLLAEEIVGTGENDAASVWLSRSLQRALGRAGAIPGLAPPEFALRADPNSRASMLLHGSLLCPDDWIADDLICGALADDPERAAVFALRPANLPGPPPPPAEEPGAPPAAEPPEAPPPTSPGPNHIFVSYRHADMGRIAPLLRALTNSGLPIWFDSGLAAGDDWIEVLEEKIQAAAVVLVMLSQAAVDSKYVRREVTYADVINKPILPVLLENVELRHGLNLTLHGTQQVSAARPDFVAQLLRRAQEFLAHAGPTTSRPDA